MSFDMSKIHWITGIDISSQFEAQNRRVIEEPKEELIFNLCQ